MNIKHKIAPAFELITGAAMVIVLILLSACRHSEIPVYVEVDQGVITHRTNAQTVRNVLTETGITLGDLDRVEPDLYVQISPELVIRVIRITETTETETFTIPFEQRIVVNEALPEGEKRLAQLGSNGEETVVTRIVFENGVEVSRTEVSRSITIAPVEELVVIGGQGNLPKVQFNGIIVYLSGGNAWMMKDNSTARRSLTTTGDLDGRAFSLSADGSTLLYSRVPSDTITAPLNELWQVSTRIVGEEPISLPVTGVLYAAWSPVVTASQIAYSTAERVPGRPGWRADNNLLLWDVTNDPADVEELLPANTSGLYPWWGTTYAWSPDGSRFAYATAGEIGVIDVVSRTVSSLATFVPYQTNSEWVWIPAVSWSPNSQFVAATIHGDPDVTSGQESDEAFDVWLFAADGDFKIKLREQTGMWSNPVWFSKGIAFGQAIDPLKSANSRYKLNLVDWDGSNKQVLFPPANQIGPLFPEMSWAANGESAVFVHQDNLYLLSADASVLPQQLTSDNQSHRPVWGTLVDLSVSAPLTVTTALSLPVSLTITPSITTLHTISVTSAITTRKDETRENIID